MNTKTVMGYVVVGGILGFTGYAIYKHLKSKKEYGEAIHYEEWSTDKQLEDHRNAEMDAHEDDLEILKEDIREHAQFNRGYDVPKETMRIMQMAQYEAELAAEEEAEEEEDEEEYIEFDIIEDPYESGLSKEDRKLKHDPDSQQARQQFINMELADFEVGDPTYRTLATLFTFPFNPTNDGDYDLKTKLMDYRAQFFGTQSRWVRDISYAEVLLHYAKLARYNYDEDIKYWVETFLQYVPLDHEMSSSEVDAMLTVLNDHKFHNPHSDTYGIFNLSDDSMSKAIEIANRNVDKSVTYDIEFNEFLKNL